jgi:N6-adenosine-specific RNA methylase IME4
MTDDVPGPLALYDAARAALAEAKRVDEVKDIRDKAIAMAAYARQGKNRDLEADAVEIRMRATRRLDELRRAQAETVGLNQGAAAGGKKNGPRGSLIDPRDLRPTLASQAIDKHLAHDARVLGALSEEDFEQAVIDARAFTNRAFKAVVNAKAIEQERAAYRARVAQGGAVTDLVALAASGFRAGLISADPPWPFETYSVQGRQRSPDRNYSTMTLGAIAALPVPPLAAEDCALLGVWPDHPGAIDVIRAWDFDYKTAAFVWVKTTKHAKVITLDGEGLHWGMGFATRSNTEPCLLATRGRPLRLNAGVHQVIIAPVGVHSEKPDEAYRRMERLYGGPYLDLFARKPRPGWLCWGDELPPPSIADVRAAS